jgi:hypothetical protein
VDAAKSNLSVSLQDVPMPTQSYSGTVPATAIFWDEFLLAR